MRHLVRTIAIVSGSTAMPLEAWAEDRPWDVWGMHHPMWGVWGLSMMIVMFVLWALVIAGVVLAVRWLMASRREPVADRALAVLRERYARGEIDREEFEAKRRDLQAA